MDTRLECVTYDKHAKIDSEWSYRYLLVDFVYYGTSLGCWVSFRYIKQD